MSMAAGRRPLQNKVPEVTLWFWIIKVLCTTVGETAADFLNVNLGFGLGGTSAVTGVLLAAILVAQLRARRYVPALYWTTVAFVSIFGTLVTDALATSAGVSLELTTLLFTVLLGATFLAWFRTERTLSIHSITTTRREIFYWTAILFTFALGTATGDLMSEGLGFGYLNTGLIVVGVITAAALAWRLGLNAVLSFWIIYVLTRPLGASLGDLLTQPHEYGGLGLGATTTSVIFLVAIVAVVVYLQRSKVDRTPAAAAPSTTRPARYAGLQTAVVLVLLIAAGGTTYAIRRHSLDAAAALAESQAVATGGSPLGDLTAFRTISQDTLDKLNAGDQSGATARVDDLERQWDTSQATLKPRDGAAWTTVDGKIDTVLRALRSTSPDMAQEKTAVQDLLSAL